jgi:hypothetical protein
MFQMLFGSREQEPPQKRAKANDIKQFAKTHNLLVRTGKVKLPKKKAKAKVV